MALLTCENVTLGYDGKKIIESLSFTVEKGDYLCIVGENGSGKTTLMKAVLGLKSPVSGKISYGEGLKQSRIGYLPQQTVVQKDFPASVYEIILSGCQNRLGFRPFYGKAEKEIALRNIEKLGLTELKTRCYRELSGGQQQRVLLARALCAATSMILLDEPVTGLDPAVTAEFYGIINDLNKKDKMTVVMISHDVNVSLKYADKILHIGKELFFGTKDEYISSAVFSELNKGGESNG